MDGILIAQREPTKEMRTEAQSMGYADWPGQRKIPRMQILTTQGILERDEKPILPESWLIGAPRKARTSCAQSSVQSWFTDTQQ